MDKIIYKVIDMLDEDEEILSSLKCSIRTFVYRRMYRPGVLVATNKRFIFYGYNLLDVEFIEIFDYKDVLSVIKKESILREFVFIRTSADSIRFSYILSDNTDEFVSLVNDAIN